MRAFTVEFDPDTKLYGGIVPGLPGAHTQAPSLDELHDNVKELVELCLEEWGESVDDLPRSVGHQQMEVAV